MASSQPSQVVQPGRGLGWISMYVPLSVISCLLTVYSSRIFASQCGFQDQESAPELLADRSNVLFVATCLAACAREFAAERDTPEI